MEILTASHGIINRTNPHDPDLRQIALGYVLKKGAFISFIF